MHNVMILVIGKDIVDKVRAFKGMKSEHNPEQSTGEPEESPREWKGNQEQGHAAKAKAGRRPVNQHSYFLTMSRTYYVSIFVHVSEIFMTLYPRTLITTTSVN